MPKCLDCHAEADTVNEVHRQHWPDWNSYPRSLDCKVCHEQSYTSCSGCHTAGEWKTDGFFSSDSSLKLGLNPDKMLKPEVKWVTLRHVPVTPETYAPWGLATLAGFDSRPTWNHTSPHTISQITTRTDTTPGVFVPVPTEKKFTMHCHFHAGRTYFDGRNRTLFVDRFSLLDN